MNFDWPLGKVWEGYLNPHFQPCPNEESGLCSTGYSAAGKWLHAIARHIAMIGDQAVEEPHAAELCARGMNYPHPYLTESAFSPRKDMSSAALKKLRAIDDEAERRRAFERHLRENPPQLLPFTEDILDLVTRLAGRRPSPPFGNGLAYDIEQRLKKAARLPKDWGTCKVCEGHAIDPSVRAAHEAWEPSEPPTGDGFQLWETTSEGSPMSPVFGTIEELCAWCADNATTFGSFKASAERWRQMLDVNFVHHTEGNVTFM